MVRFNDAVNQLQASKGSQEARSDLKDFGKGLLNVCRCLKENERNLLLRILRVQRCYSVVHCHETKIDFFQLKLPIHSLYSLVYKLDTSWLQCNIYNYIYNYIYICIRTCAKRTTAESDDFPPAHCLHTVFAKKFASFTPGLRCLLAVLPDARAPP